jgi:hypothetical protein
MCFLAQAFALIFATDETENTGILKKDRISRSVTSESTKPQRGNCSGVTACHLLAGTSRSKIRSAHARFTFLQLYKERQSAVREESYNN